MEESGALPLARHSDGLVAKTLAKQFSAAVEDHLCPFPICSINWSGCGLGHAVRAATDGNPEATVLSCGRSGGIRMFSGAQ